MKDESKPIGGVPVRLLVGGLVIGVAAGAIAPVSEYERRKAVPTRSDLTSRLQRALNDLLDHARSVVQETFAAASDSANAHGQQLATDVRQQFSEAPQSSLEREPNAPAS